MSDDRSDADRFACVSCGDPVPVDDVTCPTCGYGHVDGEELWAIAVLSPFVFLLFGVLVLWALDTFLPTAYGALGPRAVVLLIAVLFAAPLAQFLRDHVAYRRAVADARGRGGHWPPRASVPALAERLDRLTLTLRVGAAAVLLGRIAAPFEPGPGYATALRIAELAGGVLLLHAGAETYRLREELRLREHLLQTVRRSRELTSAGASRGIAAIRAIATGLAPYVGEVARGSRSVAADVGTAATRVEAALHRLERVRRRLSERRAVPVGRGGAEATATRIQRSWRRSLSSVERHWPAWGVTGIVELWIVSFATGIGVTFLTETMLVTWIAYTYFLFEDVAVTRERYDWEPWWWAYSITGLLPIVNIGVGTVYLLRRELVRRAFIGEESENGDEDRSTATPRGSGREQHRQDP